jgi:hypothetical protein
VLEGGVSVLKPLMHSRDTGGRRRPPERKNLPERAALLSFCSAIKSGSLPSNPDELVAIGVTKISEISAICAHARRAEAGERSALGQLLPDHDPAMIGRYAPIPAVRD